MCAVVWVELNAVEQVEEIQEQLELMKPYLQDEQGEDGSQPLGSEAVRAAIEAADEAGVRAVPGDRIIREEATTVDSTGRVELGPEYANEDVRVIVVDDDEPAAE